MPGGLKLNHMCPWKREAREIIYREGDVKTKAEIGVTQPQAKESWWPQKLKEARSDSFLRPSEEAKPW